MNIYTRSRSVNARLFVRTKKYQMRYKWGMKLDSWYTRLLAVIEADGRSLREISIAAGLGQNFISQMIRKGDKYPGPAVESVRRICEALNVSAAYIFTGSKMTPEVEELVRLFSRCSEEQKTSLIQMLRSLQPSTESGQAQGADFPQKDSEKD